MAGFTQGELEIMRTLWEHGPLAPPRIQEYFPRPIRNAALRSALMVLLEKGHVTREKRGRAYVYSAHTPHESAFQKMTRRLTEVFCGGSPAALIAQLIKTEKLSAEDIRELQRVAATRAKSETCPRPAAKKAARKGKPS